MSPPARDEMPVRRIDRFLTFMSLGLIVVSILCVFAAIFSRPLGVTNYGEGLWPLILLLPNIALPLGFVLIVVLLVMSFLRRARANKGH
ncbi:multidrug ABC transporter ATPase [Microbacterium sp. P06]|uniref:multidrug ABC transporter ATPase n=1 Tax=unclassified Microbacterium TaxID=2609290 RepID=UPI0037464476